jgi:4-amino-4-deoxy-L-arabinose transferase-like glycosyltransferase
MGAHALLMRARRAALARAWIFEALLVGALLGVGVVAHAWNLFNFPRYQGDEGVYVAAAWSVMHGNVFPYTYSYGHPPLGWAMIGVWCQLTGGFFTFGTAINSGRVFILFLDALASLFVYLTARKLTGNIWIALLAMALFSLSPLSINYQREVLLDNIATFWVMLALYLLVASESRMRYILGSALAFGLAFLSKETAVILLPVFIYGVWLVSSKFQRRYAVVLFCYLALALVSSYVLLALLKNELFPTGTLLGGTNPHVSMITTYLQQAGRGSNGGSFLEQWDAWRKDDGLLLLGGMVAIAGNLLVSRWQPRIRIVPLLPLIYLLFLARGGVTFAYYIIPLLPFLALNVAIFLYYALRFIIIWLPEHTRMPQRAGQWLSAPPWARRLASVPRARVLQAALLLVVVGILTVLAPYEARMNTKNLTANETGPQIQAMEWMSAHVPRSAMIIANHYNYVDMRTPGGIGAGNGAPFAHVEMYWVVATDPAVGTGIFHNDWNNVDYIMADSDLLTDAKNFNMTLILNALDHATLIKKFQNKLFWVAIYQVQHIGANDLTQPTIAEQISRPASATPAAQPTTATPHGGSGQGG